jgi:hypothetical protein
MRPLALAALAVAAAVCLALPTGVGAAASTTTYRGMATGTDGFKYGKVIMKVRRNKVTSVKIESVTTTGCGGFVTLVFAPSARATQITRGSARLHNGRLSVTYRPVKSIEDQTTTLRARVRGGKVRGTFKSGDMCTNAGRFTARR